MVQKNITTKKSKGGKYVQALNRHRHKQKTAFSIHHLWLFVFVIAVVVVNPITVFASGNRLAFRSTDRLSPETYETKALTEKFPVRTAGVFSVPLSAVNGDTASDEAVSASIDILESLDVPTDEDANTGFKAWMSYKVFTSKSSSQYAMQQEAWTDENGFRRYGDYYMIALGTFYAQGCGETFLITLEDGSSFKAITGDIKDDKHTDSKHQHRNGCIVEFIVDSKAISKSCRIMGDMSYAGTAFSGRIASIERITE